jgi:hypothetical protein
MRYKKLRCKSLFLIFENDVQHKYFVIIIGANFFKIKILI